MKVFRIALFITGLTVALVGGLLVYGKRGMNGPYASVSLAGYARPMTVAVIVLDSKGAPVSEVAVQAESLSGTSIAELTDANGFAAIEPGETEVLALNVAGKRVWNSPYRDDAVAQLFGPSCAGGLLFAVTLKAEQNRIGHPATRPVVETEGGNKPQHQADGRSRVLGL